MPRKCQVTQKYLDICYYPLRIPYPCGFSGDWWAPWTWRITWCYWTWNIPYPCLKTRTVSGWCYNCTQVRRVCYGVFCIAYCCDNGKEYSWIEPAFLMFGESWSAGGSKSSVDPLKEEGNCKSQGADPQEPYEPPGPGDGPGPTPPGGVSGVVHD